MFESEGQTFASHDRLRNNLPGKPSTVDGQNDAMDVVCRRRGQENRSATQIRRIAPAASRDAPEDFAAPLRVVAQTKQHVDLLLHQQTHRRRKRARRTDDRCMGPMARAERIVDIGIDPLDQRCDELWVVALLARIEAVLDGYGW